MYTLEVLNAGATIVTNHIPLKSEVAPKGLEPNTLPAVRLTGPPRHSSLLNSIDVKMSSAYWPDMELQPAAGNSQY